MKKIIKKWLKEYYLLDWLFYRVLLIIPSDKLLSYRYKNKLGVKPNLKNPKSYNEKLTWLMLNWNNQQAKNCADKYLVRDYVEKKVGVGILNELFQVLDNSDEINLETLPNRFVIKSTQGCGMNYICTDKNQVTKKEIIKKLRGYTELNYFYYKSREVIYKDMKPRIIIEKFLGDTDKVPKDYKIFCFNGKPFMIQVDIDRFEEAHRKNFYDCEWNLLDVDYLDYPSDPSQIEECPKVLRGMLNYAELLSVDFPHVRVDFYVVEDQIIFGELTFSIAAGTTNWNPKEFDIILGEKFELPSVV